MKKKYAIVTAIVVAVLGVALTVHAEARFRHASQTWGGPPMAGRYLQHLADVLDLTDAQQTQIKQMWKAELPTIQPLLQQLAAQHKQMVAATQSGKFDEAQVRPIANQQAQLIAQLIVEKQKLQSQVYAILTPDQQAKMTRLQQRRMDRMQNWLNKQTSTQP